MRARACFLPLRRDARASLSSNTCYDVHSEAGRFSDGHNRSLYKYAIVIEPENVFI